MNQKERLAICSGCSNRSLDFEHGYICQLTGKVADFNGQCKSYVKDESVTDTIKVRTKERPWVPLFEPPPVEETAEDGKKKSKNRKKDRPTGEALKKLRRYQSFLYAFLGGLLITVVSIVTWCMVAAETGNKEVYLALIVGLLVGIAVRFFGAGIYRVFGVLAAVLSLAGSVLGYYLIQTSFLSDLQAAQFAKLVDYIRPEILFDIIQNAFVPLDLLFYGLATLLGYLLAIRRINGKKLAQLTKGEDKGAPALYWLRLPLILALILVPAYIGYTLSTQGETGWSTVNYPSGEKMSEGKMVKGQKSGKWTCWHENGNLKSIGSYSDGKKDSLWQIYDESGIMTASGMYNNGLANGVWMRYYPNGDVADSGAYLDGNQEGLWKYWYENGSLKSATTFKEGKRHGKRSLWSDSGKLVKEDFYEEGELIEVQ
jgi:hypothetical protein